MYFPFLPKELTMLSKFLFGGLPMSAVMAAVFTFSSSPTATVPLEQMKLDRDNVRNETSRSLGGDNQADEETGEVTFVKGGGRGSKHSKQSKAKKQKNQKKHTKH